MVEPKKAMTRSPLNTGTRTVTSRSWPAVLYGSLVMSTSPGTSESGGYSSRIEAAPMASELMWPGVPVTAWATMRARRSNTALARSPASRTIGLKAARWSALACSLTVAMRLCHSTSSSMGSNAVLTTRAAPAPCPAGRHERAVVADHDGPSRTDHRGRLALLDDRRSVEAGARAEGLAAVDRDAVGVRAAAEACRPVAVGRRRRCPRRAAGPARRERWWRRRTGATSPPRRPRRGW